MQNHRRKQNVRPLAERVLILCEGSQTEPRYFEGIKADRSRRRDLPVLAIEIPDTKQNTSIGLVKVAKELQEEATQDERPFKQIWIVVDRDSYQRHSRAFDQAKALGIKIAFSSICFEYWFLLHFKPTTTPFNKASELISYLKKNGYRDYKKNLDHYSYLKDSTPTAIAHAKKVRKTLADSYPERIYERNPYTDVDILVGYLLNLK